MNSVKLSIPPEQHNPTSGVHRRHGSNEHAVRQAMAFDCNLLRLELQKAMDRLEECRRYAMHAEESLAPVLPEIAELMGDATRLTRALNVALVGAVGRLGGT